MHTDAISPDPSLLRTINHNLLPVLRALLRECSVTRAAETLGMTQPAASAALGRLRLMLNDPLLIKAGRRMILSPRAAILQPQVEDICLRLDRLWRNPAFRAETSERCFTLSGPDYTQVVLAQHLMPLLAVGAPHMTMRFLDVPVDDVIRHVVNDIDLMISIRQPFEHATADFVVETLYHERIVAVVGPRHRLHSAADVAPEDYRRDNFLVFLAGARFLEKRYDELRNAVRAPSTPLLVSQNYNALMLIAAQSDCVALLPYQLARVAERALGMRIIDAEYSRFDVDVCLVYDRQHQLDQAHAWFRARLKEAAATMQAK